MNNLLTRSFALICFVVFPCLAWCQTNGTRLNWAHTIGGTSSDWANNVISDNSGNIYTTGIFHRTADFDPGVGVHKLTTAGASTFINKFDSAGKFIWATQIGIVGHDLIMDIKVDADENIYFSGSFEGQFDLLVSGKTRRFKSNGYTDIIIAKLNKNGQAIWAHQMGDWTGDRANALHFDSKGNLIIAGSFKGKIDFDPGTNTTELDSKTSVNLFVLKLDTAGNFIWAKQLQSDKSIMPHSFDINGNNEMVFTGQINGKADFDPGIKQYNLNSINGQAFVCKLDSVGNFIWAKQFGNINLTRSETIRFDHNSEIIVGGHFGQTGDFDPGSTKKNFTAIGSYDLFLLKLNKNGSLVWAKQFGSLGQNLMEQIKTDSNGNIFLAGSFSGTVDFDPGSGSVKIVSNVSQDGFVCQIDKNGKALWAKGFGGTSNDKANSIYLNNNDILLTGSFQGFADFDFSRRAQMRTSNGVDDYYVLSISQCTPTNAQIDTTVCGQFHFPSGKRSVNQSGTYYDTLDNSTGCDSFIKMNVIIEPAFNTQIKKTACGEYRDKNGKKYTESGLYNVKFRSRNGCDSLVTWDLTVNPNSYSQLKMSSCLSYTLPSGSATFYQSGFYMDTISSINGCDSIIEIDVTILNVDTSISRSSKTLVAHSTSQNIQWLNCSDNYNKIQGETNRIFQPQQPGNYAAQISENGCTDTSNCYSMLTTSLPKLTNPYFNVYPNPSRGTIRIDYETDNDKLNMIIYDLSGKIVVEQPITNEIIELDVTPGFYSLFVIDGHELVGKSKLFIQGSHE